MNPYHNSIEIIGNLGKKPILSYLNNGTAVTRLRIAVNEKITERQTNQEKENTQWFSVILYGKQAELACDRLNSGDSVFIRGAIRMRRYMQGEQQREVWEIHADRMILLTAKKAES